MKRGKLYLIPTSITSNKKNELNNEAFDKIKGIKKFIVENEKNARSNLKEWGLDNVIQEIELIPIDKAILRREPEAYFDPIVKGESVGLMTDAGVPAIADPGEEIVREAHKRNIQVETLAGPSSIFMALAASGLNAEKFKFNGYLPVERNMLEAKLMELEIDAYDHKCTQIFIETPYRSFKIWSALLKHLKDSTDLHVSIGLMEADAYSKTAKVGDWKSMNWPEFSKHPAVFIFA